MGDLEIRGGRVVAVDTETLRHAAAQAALSAADAETLRSTLIQADQLLGTVMIGGTVAHPVTAAGTVAEQGRMLVHALRDTASAYELVELQARQAVAMRGDEHDRRDAALIGRRIADLEASSPAVAELAEQAVAEAPDPFATVAAQWAWGTLGVPTIGLSGLALLGWASAEVSRRGHGRLAEGSRLQGSAPTPTLTLTRVEKGTAPTSVSAIARRVPGGEVGSIRVEKYSMPGGTQRFAVYIPGTRFGKEAGAFGWSSNVPLYTGTPSASYEAARAALQKAGAKPGDSVMVSGHSQGAMIASRLALEKEYHVPMVVGFGNPVQADVGAETLQVDLRHSDDPVPLLAAGGHDASIGAPGSLVVERNVDPLPSVNDLRVGAHQMDAYSETAEMLDSSADPRMDAVRERLAEFTRAESVEVFVYDTSRGVTPSSADAG
jgi:hypothetical protein